MTLNFQEVREQVKQMGENAPARQQRLNALRNEACDRLASNAQELEALRQKVQKVVKNYDPTLRCALPVEEPLDSCHPLPELPEQITLLAADGSQIAPDRNAEVDYCLINVGAIQMRLGSPLPPTITVKSNLIYDEKMYTQAGTLTDAQLSLMRDLEEREVLRDLAKEIDGRLITFTDGPMELWGAKDVEGGLNFQDSLRQYHAALTELYRLGAITAGYVDKPAANLVVRLLEVSKAEDNQLADIRHWFPFRGVRDTDLFKDLLGEGDRSAVFAMQSKSAEQYREHLALHFFYLNVGTRNHPWLARVEIPAWVAGNPAMLDALHAALAGQCRILGSRPYPYLLHRAHESAVVRLEEKDQVTQMIILELRKRGVEVGELSNKQYLKNTSTH